VCGAVVFAALVGTTPAAATLQGLPQGFQERVIPGFDQPVGFAEAPDGRIFVAEKPGRVRVLRPDGTVSLVLDISNHVASNLDRGLLGIAVDRDFATNRFVYLLYVYQSNALDPTGPKVSRLTRVVVNPDNTLQSPSNPETVILGTFNANAITPSCPAPSNTSDCIPADSNTHAIGTVRVAPDGTLFVGSGDAAEGAGFTIERALRAYDERSYAGKILHIDRDGRGLPGHPFCPGDTDLTHACTKVHAMGFRNPFRFVLRADGKPIAGDVGEASREEIDVVEPGRNYGWPCYEGDIRHPTWQNLDRCQAEYAKEGTSQADASPLYAYPHTQDGGAVVAGPIYTGDLYPDIYRGTLFTADFVSGALDRLELNGSGGVTAVRGFASGWEGVDMQQLSSGELAYPALGSASFVILRYSSSNREPVARAGATPISGALPLQVSLDGSATTDADGDALTYDWDFGDGSPHSSAPSPSHTYTVSGHVTAALTVTDPAGERSRAQVDLWPGNDPPQLELQAPSDGASYRDGQPVQLRAVANDPQDGELTGDAIAWDVVLHHNTHEHPFQRVTGTQAAFTPVIDHDADSFYEIRATATDSLGMPVSKTVVIRPETVALALASDPPGAPVSYASLSHTAPFSTRSAIGFRTDISAVGRFTAGSGTWDFDHWSDGGARVHSINVPAADVVYTAVYRPADLTPPETTITEAPAVAGVDRRATFRFASSEAGSTFECKVDNDVWFLCASPYATSPQSVKQHTFRVRAIDPAQNVDPTPATATWQVLF
jgi:glucose/arabinose dehydrogenase